MTLALAAEAPAATAGAQLAAAPAVEAPGASDRAAAGGGAISWSILMRPQGELRATSDAGEALALLIPRLIFRACDRSGLLLCLPACLPAV